MLKLTYAAQSLPLFSLGIPVLNMSAILFFLLFTDHILDSLFKFRHFVFYYIPDNVPVYSKVSVDNFIP
jgi:hypothetical protein